ncbi:hypothetical protein [Streptomyces subrutilus]|uniref:DUF4034 domain-containing protein n=1 Tax=Streptomyces subrutilus TaxID=36818 RepID=A0A1E5PLJ7_9ACTN|nr:hypothetical protein [Streptomyces subrutilus]OEJ30394.1 hypothetical protein BGK67_02625 [Streptomyces subrutilus]
MTIFLAIALGVFLIVLYLLFITPLRVDRWVETHFAASAYGLPPREVLDDRRPGPPPAAHRAQEMQAVADAAWDGDWKPAERYVREAGEDWDERWARLELLQQIAREDGAWFDAWRAAEPGNCDAATLHASIMVRRAWEIRGGAFAHEVPASDMNRFRAMLPAAIEEARKAALLDPANPGPWVVMVTAARGAQYGHSQFNWLWEGLIARAPHHYEGHWQGLQYWCAKWYGSNRQMMRFARQAVRKAPAGSPLAGIYLHALNELTDRSPSLALPVTPMTRSLLKRIAASFDQVAPDDERLPVLRHLLAYYMLRSMMYAPALEQFRRIGPWCGAEPWRKEGNPVVAFEAARGRAVKLSRTRPAPTPQAFGLSR